MHGFGLLVIDKQSYIYLNVMNKPYNKKEYGSSNFIEKIQIPRGRKENTDKNGFSCAIREFIEETLLIPTGICYTDKVGFPLRWYDNGTWTYRIYILFCEKLIPSLDHKSEKNLALVKMKYDQYVWYMIRKQLHLYKGDNYMDFFKYVNKIKYQKLNMEKKK